MNQIAAGLFAVAALGGVFLAVRSFKDQGLPWLVTIVHGAVAASGLVLLLLGVMKGEGGQLALIALVILVAAALGGFFLLTFHIRDQKAPPAIIIIHALVAVTGFGTLLASLVG